MRASACVRQALPHPSGAPPARRSTTVPGTPPPSPEARGRAGAMRSGGATTAYGSGPGAPPAAPGDPDPGRGPSSRPSAASAAARHVRPAASCMRGGGGAAAGLRGGGRAAVGGRAAGGAARRAAARCASAAARSASPLRIASRTTAAFGSYACAQMSRARRWLNACTGELDTGPQSPRQPPWLLSCRQFDRMPVLLAGLHLLLVALDVAVQDSEQAVEAQVALAVAPALHRHAALRARVVPACMNRPPDSAKSHIRRARGAVHQRRESHAPCACGTAPL